MDYTPQNPGQSEPRRSGRFSLFWGVSAVLSSVVFLGFMVWPRGEPLNASDMIFACTAYAIVCVGLAFMAFMRQRALQKRDQTNAPPDNDDPLHGGDATNRRVLRWFQYYIWAGVIFSFVLPYLMRLAPLPQTIKRVVPLGFMAVLLVGVFGFIWWLAPRSPLVKQMRPVARRLGRRLAFAMLLYIAVFAAATWYDKVMHPAGLASVLMALAPSVPLLFAIRAVMLFLKEESDEFLRARMLEGWAIATALMLAVCTIWGFLDQFEVVPHLPLWAAPIIWACCLLPTQLLLQQRDT